MEKKDVLLKDFIYEIPQVMHWNNLASLVRYLDWKFKNEGFADGGLITNGNVKGRVDKTVRDVNKLEMTNNMKSITDQHWANVLYHFFYNALQVYRDKFPTIIVNDIIDIQCLRYPEGGHYQLHTDDHPSVSRTLSFIFRLNNDYEGGTLRWEVNGKEFFKSETKPNSMLMWPSFFMFPHQVEPVSKGTRWSVVAWAR